MKIILNGIERETDTNAPNLSYENAAVLAGYDPDATLTVVYDKGQTGGSLTKGQWTEVTEGMIVSVADTSRA